MAPTPPILPPFIRAFITSRALITVSLMSGSSLTPPLLRAAAAYARPHLTCLRPSLLLSLSRQVIIQSLWHLSAFRHRFIALDYTHQHRVEPCVFCALRTIFSQYQYSDSVIIPPDTLRQALHDIDTGQGQGRFLLGVQGDAEEALDEILSWLHSDQVQRGAVDGAAEADTNCVPPCISHAVFGAQSMDVRVCRCGATSDPETSSSFLYRIYVSDLLPHLQTTQPFPTILRSLYKEQVYSCPTNEGDTGYRCKGPAHVDRWLLSQPLVFTLMLAWKVETTREEIEQVWGALAPALRPEEFCQGTAGYQGAEGGDGGVPAQGCGVLLWPALHGVLRERGLRQLADVR